MSDAANLAPADTNGVTDVFVHDRQTGTTQRVSVSSGGAEGDWDSESPALSGDGRYVAFQSGATTLVPSGTFAWDIYVHDLQTGTTEQVSLSSGGAEPNAYCEHPAISDDGRFVAFASEASNLAPSDITGWQDIFVRDRQTGTTEWVSLSSAGVAANGTCDNPSISGDGRFVAFSSYASNLVLGDTNWVRDVFVHDRQTGTTERA